MKTVTQALAETTIPRERALQAIRELFGAGFIGWDGTQWIILPERALRRNQLASLSPVGFEEER
jgi:hypothetical protein